MKLDATQTKFPSRNIPTNSLTVINKKTDIIRCSINQFSEGEIQLTGFAVSQFLEGAELQVNDDQLRLSREDVKLMFSGKAVVIRFQFAPAIMADDQSGEIRIVCFDDFVESGQFFRIHILPLFLVYFLTG